MSQSADAELELFRQGVNCAAVLERRLRPSMWWNFRCS